MKIGILIDNLIVNGAQMVVRYLASELSRLEHDIYIYYFHRYPDRETIEPLLKNYNINFRWVYGVRYSLRNYISFIDAVRTIQFMKKDRLDIINIHSWERAYSLKVSSHMPQNFPIVYTHHGTKICNGSKQMHNRLHLGVNSRYRYEYEDLNNNRNCSSIDIGIDPMNVSRHIITKAKARQILGLSDRSPLMITVGRCNRHRGADIWIEVVQQLCKIDPNYYFAFIGADGKGEYYHKLWQLSRQNPNIILTPTLPHVEVIQWMCAADVLFIPSRTESLALKALEALHCGCPVVMHFLGVLEDIIQNGVNGEIVDYMDIRSMVEANRKWLDARKKVDTKIPEKHIVTTMVNNYLVCFENMINK
jgi:glycosyltransferase involved in cell wall biosynthesis